MRPHELDGTTLEGGGQLLRLSVCLSALTGRPILLNKIRGARYGGGGLKEQHLACVKWFAHACDAEADGMELKSRKLLFVPSRRTGCWWKFSAVRHGNEQILVRSTTIELATSGAVTLVLQAVLPFLLFAGAEDIRKTESQPGGGQSEESGTELGLYPILLKLRGGTNVSNSPSIDYVIHVLLPNLKLLDVAKIEVLDGLRNDTGSIKRGWSADGSAKGHVSLLIHPIPQAHTLKSFVCPSRGEMTCISVILLAPTDIRQYLKEYCLGCLQSILPETSQPRADATSSPDIEMITDEDSGDAKRIHLLLVAHTASGFRLGSDCLFVRKIGKTLPQRQESGRCLVDTAVEGLKHELSSGRCLDEWMEDQVVVYQALAKGYSHVARSTVVRDSHGVKNEHQHTRPGKPASLHTRTVQWVAEELLGVQFDTDGGCNGTGYEVG